MINAGKEIIEMLTEQGITLDIRITNTIDLLASEIYDKGKTEGIEEGKRIGIQQACREFEVKISLLRSRNITE